MKTIRETLVLTLILLAFPALPTHAQNPDPARAEVTQIPVVFTGGYETDPADHGRPVVLVAAALDVPTEVFRAAFRRVKPAPAGEAPEPKQLRRNKEALLQTLAPYGVTNDRLDEVSNYYRYNRSRGEWWRHTRAVAYATVRHGVVTGFTIVNPGSGYSSPPQISVPGLPAVKAVTALSFDADFKKNGSIKEITLAD